MNELDPRNRIEQESIQGIPIEQNRCFLMEQKRGFRMDKRRGRLSLRLIELKGIEEKKQQQKEEKIQENVNQLLENQEIERINQLIQDDKFDEWKLTKKTSSMSTQYSDKDEFEEFVRNSSFFNDF